MKKLLLGCVTIAVAGVLLNGCKKSGLSPAETAATTAVTPLHGMGLNPASAEELASVPKFSTSLFANKLQSDGLTYSGTRYTSYILTHPQIRDQGQIGSCTGFCGATVDEILYYYQNNTVTPVSNFTTANVIAEAQATEIPNTSDEPSYGSGNTAAGAFSPLFLYYVERVVIQKEKITADQGANMVNIGETLQGLSNNTGTGTALTYGGYTFDGIPTNAEYPYPWVSSGGYNVATPTTAPYTTAPYTYFSYGSKTIPTSPNNFPIGAQSGSTTSSGSTTVHGYYEITDAGTTLVTDVENALLNNKPVLMGLNIYDNRSYTYFEGLSTTKYTYNPLNSSGGLARGVSLLGGHATPIIGYVIDSTISGGGAFIVENQWGTPWGAHGYYLMPFSVIQSTKVVPAGSLFVAII
ncbi:MAG TPA: C1 family peptidase [Mucilaginibacter sp.]|nr:C1 family peptidase [Mucilaginibacter sp.]